MKHFPEVKLISSKKIIDADFLMLSELKRLELE